MSTPAQSSSQLEEIRRLQRERWQRERGITQQPNVASTPIITNTPVVQQSQQPMSDEEYARMLQEQFDREAEQEVVQQPPTIQNQPPIQPQSRRRLPPPTHPALINQHHHEHLLENLFPPSLNQPMRFPPSMMSNIHPMLHNMLNNHPLFAPLHTSIDDEEDFIMHHPQQSYISDLDTMSYEQLQQLAEQLGTVNKGASKEQIDETSMKFVISDPSKQVPKDQPECPICMTNFEKGESVRRLICLHLFHTDCIDKWLQTNSTCPICKTDIKSSQNAESQQ
jgi:hypothetical protein